MSKAQVKLTLAIYACPEDQQPVVEKALEAHGSLQWSANSLIPGNLTAEITCMLGQSEIGDLVSKLIQVSGIHFEAIKYETEFGELHMFVPGLGLFRADTNSAGEIMIGEERIRNAMEQAAGNYRELQRLLRSLLGQSWDDVLEPHRAGRYNQNVALFNRAV